MYTITRDETTGRYVVTEAPVLLPAAPIPIQGGNETVASFRTREGAERWVKRWGTSKASN